MPDEKYVALGPRQQPLSWSPPYTQYGFRISTATWYHWLTGSDVMEMRFAPRACELSGGKAVRQLGPMAAAVRRPGQRVARPAAMKAVGAPAALMRRGVEGVWIRRIHGDVAHAGVFVDLQRRFPRASAVGRLE